MHKLFMYKYKVISCLSPYITFKGNATFELTFQTGKYHCINV
jgi:hypothetical protein